MTRRPPPGVDWDEDKNERNIRAHSGVNFDNAIFAFRDPHLLDYESRWEEGELRWSLLGMVQGNVLYVSYTERDDGHVTRIISARKATRKECDAYFAR